MIFLDPGVRRGDGSKDFLDTLLQTQAFET
jgi:hypothetical protein